MSVLYLDASSVAHWLTFRSNNGRLRRRICQFHQPFQGINQGVISSDNKSCRIMFNCIAPPLWRTWVSWVFHPASKVNHQAAIGMSWNGAFNRIWMDMALCYHVYGEPCRCSFKGPVWCQHGIDITTQSFPTVSSCNMDLLAWTIEAEVESSMNPNWIETWGPPG